MITYGEVNESQCGKSCLGPSAGQVWAALQIMPATVEELVQITGRDIRTIENALARMSTIVDRKTGEIITMVVKSENGIWTPQLVDLDLIALVVGTAGATERQKNLHARERCDHARSLENCNISKMKLGKAELQK